MGNTTTWYKFWQHFEAFIFSIFLHQFQKDPFRLIILYHILFYFIHVHNYRPRAMGDNPWGQFFLMEAERSYHFDYWLHVSKKYLCSLLLCTYFHDFIHVYSPGRGRQPIGAKILMSTGRPHQFSHLLQVSIKSLPPLILYTSFHNLLNVYSHGSVRDRQPQRNKILMSTETSCHFGHLL